MKKKKKDEVGGEDENIKLVTEGRSVGRGEKPRALNARTNKGISLCPDLYSDSRSGAQSQVITKFKSVRHHLKELAAVAPNKFI